MYSESGLTPLPTKHSSLLSHGARVACWPSTGGIWIKRASPVDLGFLNLLRKNDTERPPEKIYDFVLSCPSWDSDIYVPPPLTEEDFLCQKMRMVGADFWELPQNIAELNVTIESTVKPKYFNHLGFYWDVGHKINRILST